jgi:hypothetical protein
MSEFILDKIIVWFDPRPEFDCLRRNFTERQEGMTDQEAVDANVALLKLRGEIPDGTEHIFVDVADTPKGIGDFKGARVMTSDNYEVDMAKARAIHMDRIRTARNKELVAKDITFMRAVEAGDTSAQSTIATEKQTLRDIPATFDITTDVDTPAKLRAKWPTELPDRE